MVSANLPKVSSASPLPSLSINYIYFPVTKLPWRSCSVRILILMNRDSLQASGHISLIGSRTMTLIKPQDLSSGAFPARKHVSLHLHPSNICSVLLQRFHFVTSSVCSWSLWLSSSCQDTGLRLSHALNPDSSFKRVVVWLMGSPWWSPPTV